jgi:hypothetical protein
MEVLRRLLLALGALVAAWVGVFGVIVATSGDNSGMLAVIGAPIAFWIYRLTVNWVLMYKPPPSAPKADLDY